jgi:hypothetical protein
LTVAWLLIALVGFATLVNGFYPVREWLLLFWARAWLAALVFAVASLAAGTKVLALARLPTGRLLDRSVFALALGVLIFALGLYIAGLFGLLAGWFFFAWPAALLLAGGRALLEESRRWAKHLRPFRARSVLPQSFAQALAALALVGGTAVFYLQVLAPSGISFDARWYHLPIAESYAASGRIRPFPEGWYLGAYPHLSSLLYTWAFLAPGELSHHLCLAVHLEFVLRLGTIAGISALAGRLVSGPRLRFGGAGLFLFPCVFLPWNGLNGGADDVAAFWAAPLGLSLLRYLASDDRRNGVLLGALAGAAGLTKYQAIYALAPIALVLGADLALRRRFHILLLTGATAIVVSSPHWLKNWIAYGDPLFPNLSRWLPAHPLFRGADAWLARYYWLNGADPSLSTAQKLIGAARAWLDFSFFPHGWGGLPGGRPEFGSLFTLLAPLVLWVRPRSKALLLVGCTQLGIAVWYWTYRDDRFLQALLPWLAACTVAILAALWRTGRGSVRVAVGFLVALQVAWGSDLPVMRGGTLREVIDLVADGGEDNFARHPYAGTELQAIGRRLHDPRAKLVSHDFYQTVGVGTALLCDNPAWQGAIDYLALDTPERTLKKWRRLGATHLVWPLQKEARVPEDLARDAVFARAAVAFTRSFTVAGYQVVRLTHHRARHAERAPTRIGWLGCGSERALGVYTPEGLALGRLDRALTSAELTTDASAALAEVNAVWVRASCSEATSARAVLAEQFTEMLRSGDATLMVRTRP